MIAAAFAGYAFGVAIAFVRVVLRYRPGGKVMDKSKLILGLTPRQFLVGILIGNIVGLLLQVVACWVYMQ